MISCDAVNGTMVSGAGLVGLMNGVAETFVYSSAVSTKPNNPRSPQPRVEGTALALALSFFLSFFRDS